MENKKVIVETEDVVEANELAISGEFRQPIYDPHRSIYVMIRRKK